MRIISYFCLPVVLLWAAAPVSAQVYGGQAAPVNPYYAGYAQSLYPYAGSTYQASNYAGQPTNYPSYPALTVSNSGTPTPPESIEAPSPEVHSTAPSSSYYPDTHSDYGQVDYNVGCADGSCGPNWRRHFAANGWYGSAAGLLMTRDRPNRYAITTQDGYPEYTLMSNRAADVDWTGGFEVTFGKCLGCNARWEASYWMLDPSRDSADIYSGAADLISPYNMQNVAVGPDVLEDFFDYSSGHGILRESDVYNVEFNVYYRPCGLGANIGGAYGGGCGGCGDCGCCRWNVELLAGVRYFKFEEFFGMTGVEGGANFGDFNRQAFITSNVENELIGFQIGALIDYYFHKRWSIYARPKIGIFGNRTELDFAVFRGDRAVNTWNTITNEDYPIRSTETDVSLLAEIDLGVRWDISCHWSAYASYRAVAVTGIALADEQIPFYIADVQGIRDIDSNGDLILHGFMFGMQFAY